MTWQAELPLVPRDPTTRVLGAVADPARAALLVAGGPGTGKTHLLVECAAAAVAAGLELAHVLVLTTTRPMAQRLRTRIMMRVGGAQVAPRVMTTHALAHAIVRSQRGPDEPEWILLNAPEQEFRLRELLAGHDTSQWPEDLARAATTRAFAADVRAAAARVRQLGLDPHDVEVLAARAGRPEWAVLGEFMGEYLDVVDATGAVDYAELVHRARLAMADPQRAAQVAASTRLVLVDELSELDPSQVQLVADLVAAGSGLVAFADPSTAVFGFRGAGGVGLSRFEQIFSRPGRGATRVVLDRDRDRSPAVSRALARLAARLPRNDQIPLPQPDPGTDAGGVDVLVLDSPGAEVDHVVDIVRRAHLEHGLAYSDMAVITRSHRGGLLPLARALTGAGVPVQLAGSDIALREAPAVQPLLLGLQVVLAHERGELAPPDDATALLRSSLGGVDSLEARRLGRALRRREPDGGTTSAEWFARALADPDLLDGVSVPAAALARELAQRLARAVEVVRQDADASQVLWALWDGTPWAARLRRDALAGTDASATANRDIDAVRALFDLAARDNGVRGVRALDLLVAEIQGHEIPADTARESDLGQRGVALLTAHRAKGQRWPLVVVAQVQEGTWPMTRRRGSVLDVDRLTPDGVAEAEPYSRLIDSERRAFLLACSRASAHLVVTAAQGHEGEGDQRSRFLEELGVDARVVHGRPTRPVTLSMLVAQLRATAVDPGASAALRAASALRLGRLAALTDSRGRPAARGADPATWWGMESFSQAAQPVVAEQDAVNLHGSELAMLLDCPRQWFLSRQARAEAGRSSASSLGSVIHALVGHAADDDLDLDTLTGHLDAVWDRLQFDAAWLSASEREAANQALERYAWWADVNGREVLGTEVAFDTQVQVAGERVRLSGSVDRLERDGAGRLHVVDFKTGRSKPTKAQAAADAQLGTYQLAATLGAFDVLAPGIRAVGGAELVYLRQGSDEAPTVMRQPSLDESPTLAGEELEVGPTWMHDALHHAATTVRTERFHATPCVRCRFCPFAGSCPAIVDAPAGRGGPIT